MNVIDKMTGQTFQFPDDATDDDIIAAMESGRPAPKFSPIAQQFASGIGGVAQQLIQGPQTQSTLPNIGGGAMVGLTPQQAQWTLDRVQQSNVNAMANKMQQQKAVQDQLEAEKERSQEIKLEQQRLKNDLAVENVRATNEKLLAQQKAAAEARENRKDRIANRENTMITKGIREQEIGLDREQLNATRQYNQDVLGIRERELAISEAEAANRSAQLENQGWTLEKIPRLNEATGEYEPWQAYVKRGQQPEFVAPSADDEGIVTPKSESVIRTYESLLANEMKINLDAAADKKLSLPEMLIRSQVGARTMHGLRAFDNKQQADTYYEMLRRENAAANRQMLSIQDNVREEELSPERAAEAERLADVAAKIAVLQAQGYSARYNPEADKIEYEIPDAGGQK